MDYVENQTTPSFGKTCLSTSSAQYRFCREELIDRHQRNPNRRVVENLRSPHEDVGRICEYHLRLCPKLSSILEAEDQFFRVLKAKVSGILKSEGLYLLGDFNDSVGKAGKHDLPASAIYDLAMGTVGEKEQKNADWFKAHCDKMQPFTETKRKTLLAHKQNPWPNTQQPGHVLHPPSAAGEVLRAAAAIIFRFCRPHQNL